MPAQAHHIERLKLDVDVGGMDSAMQLRGRIETLSRTRFPEVLERVFDAAIPADLHVRIDRLDLDLGIFGTERLEEDAAELLERALAEAIADAVERARRTPGADGRALTAEGAALEDLELYLVHGTARFRAGVGEFDPAADLRSLIGAQPKALTAMLRRRAHDRHAIERLVLQAGAEDLRALLAMLAPADAAAILAYHADLRRLYLESRAAPETPALPRALWVLTLEFILRDPGSQSNRRAFLAYLLEGMAMAEGIAYPALLALLHDVLEQSRKRQPPTGSLPGVLKELIDRLGEERTEPVPHPQGKAAGQPPPETQAGRASQTDFDRLAGRLEPEAMATLRIWLAGLSALHRERPLLALSEAGFERALRRLASGVLPGDSAARFDRRRRLGRLLRGLAREGGVPYAFLLESIASALAFTRGAGAPAGPAADLAADLPRVAVSRSAAADADTIAGLIARLGRYAQNEAAMAALVQGLGFTEFRVVLERLQPRHARAILADLAELADVQRRLFLFAFSESAFEAQFRALALQLAIATPAPLRRADWLRRLLDGLARAAGVDERRLPALLTGAGEALPPKSALRQAMAKIAGSRGRKRSATSGPAETETAKAGAADFRGRDATALASRLARAAPPDKAKLIGRLAEDPALLLQVATTMGEPGLAESLASFGPARAAAVTADLAFLRRRHAAEPLTGLDAAEFDRLTWTLAVAALARMGGKFHRAEFRRLVLAGIALHEGVAAGELGDWRRLEEEGEAVKIAIAEASASADSPAAPLPAAALLAHSEQFLRTGRPAASGPFLAEAARRAPAAFAALLRRLTAAASGRSAALIDRLLDWMLPEEVAAAVAPASADHAARWAAALADAPGGNMTEAWRQVLHTALADDALGDAGGEIALALIHDRRALLRHWLDHGSLAWWAPVDMRIESLLAGLPGLPFTLLRSLFDDPDPERVAVRLGRAFRMLGPAPGAILLQRLAPWAFAAGGPLAARASGLSGSALDDLRIRGAATAIAGASLDLDRLARPVPAPSEAQARQPPPPGPDGRAALFAWLRYGGPGDPPARPLRLFADLADRGDIELGTILRDGLARAETRARWAATMPEEALARIVQTVAPARARFMLDLKLILAAARPHAAPPGLPGAGRGGPWEPLLAIAMDRDRPGPRVIADRLIHALAGGAPDAVRDLRSRAMLAARQGGHINVIATLQPAPAADPPRPPAAARPSAVEAAPPEPDVGETMYVGNAGLILFNPFLPRFFERLGLFSEGRDGVQRIAGLEPASRAVHLLQYLIDQRCDRREPDLALNKLLCGVPIAAPVAKRIEPTAEELAICDGLIQAMIENWPAMKGTSPAGLRETFLQREGRLRRGEDKWALDVERKTVDVLVEQIPWSWAIVYHRWMPDALHVTW